MPTFIKAGFWQQICKPCNGYKGWLNLDQLIASIAGPGVPGPIGPEGPQGIQGEQGIQGIQGNTGNTGAQGEQGIQGIQGTAGNSVTILGSYADYAAFLAGAGSLPGTNIGDAWILLSDGSLMSWNGTNWFDAGDIQGPQGPVGPQGPIGLTGEQGIQGIQGPQGIQGIQGIPGPAGLPGLYAQTALGPIITFASGETNLIGTGVGTLSVPANVFSVGDSFIVKMCGPISCANNQNLRIRIKTNGLTLIDTGTVQLPQTTNKIFDLAIDFTITKIGGNGVAEIFANGLFSYNQDSDNRIEGVNSSAINNTTFDTTILNTLTITAEWLSSNAANSIRTQNFTLTKVY